MVTALLIALAVALWSGVNRVPTIRLVNKSDIELDEIDWMRGFIDSLRAGMPAWEALSNSNHNFIPIASKKLTQPTELPIALAQDAKLQNSLLLKALAACWQVSQQHGAPLGPAMQSALDAQLDRIMVADEIKSQLAGPKTAAVTLAMLPIATLLLAQSLGINAISWLLTSPIGLISLLIGGLLLSTGTWVMFRLAKNIEQELQL